MSEAIALAMLLLCVAAFFLLWFNRFAGLRSGGGEFAGGMSVLSGRVPYRDFFNPGPPLNALKAALLLRTLGHSLLALRAAAVAERLLLAAMLYGWLRCFVTQRAAWIASLVTIILSAGDRTDPLASYNHDAILLAMGAALCLDTLVRSRASRHRPRWAIAWLLAAGALTGMSALTKQTVGGCCAIFFALWLLFAARRVCLRRTSALGSFAVGLALPTMLVGLWLWREHALAACLHMIFVQGPAAKAGSPLDFVTRTALVAWDNVGWVVLGSFFLLLSVRPLLRASTGLSTSERPGRSRWIFLLFGGAIALAAVVGYTRWPTLHDQGKSAVYYTLLALPLLIVALLVQRKRRGDLRTLRLLLFLGTGLAVAFSLSLSWPAFEAMLLPGLALPLALILGNCTPRSLRWVVALLLLAVFLQTREKLDIPFGFDYQVEALVLEATTTSRQPLLKGMRLPPQTAKLLDDSTALAKRCLTRDETVFTYPEMGLIYTLTGATPPTLSASHNIDVVNDAFARQEAQRLKDAPPRILLYYPETEQDAEGAERLWRRSHPAGQREIVSVIEQLLPRYRLVGKYSLRDGDPPIGLYLRESDKPVPAACR